MVVPGRSKQIKHYESRQEDPDRAWPGLKTFAKQTVKLEHQHQQDQDDVTYEVEIDDDESEDRYETATDSGPVNENGAWKSFDHSTEAGRLLHRLYTRTHNKPLKHVPKNFKTRRFENPGDGTWFTGKLGVDPRQRTERREREKEFVPPKVGGGNKTKAPPPIAYVDRRKSQAVIQMEMKQEEEQPRPLPRKAVSTELEKRKLAIHFQFKGGKALPDAGMPVAMQGNIPLSLITGKPSKKKKQHQDHKIDRQVEKQKLEQEFDEIAREVEDLKQRLVAVEGKPAFTRQIASLKQQIHGKIRDMQSLDESIQSII